MSPGMNISVIICTWNNARRLEITFESLMKCVVPDGVRWEVVVVNNNCTDDTDCVVKQYADQLPIVYVQEPQKGLSRAKNAGLAKATGDLVIFTDDDVRVCKEWLEIYWKAFVRQPQGYFWGGPVKSEFEDPNVPQELLALVKDYSIVGFSQAFEGEPSLPGIRFISANWTCPRKMLDQIGPFDTSLGLNAVSGKVILGEETDVMNRLIAAGYKRWYLPQALIHHFVPRSKTSLIHIARRTQALGKTYFTDLVYNRNRPRFLGVPVLVYKTIVLSWAKWHFSHLRNCPDYRQFICLHHFLGVWQGFHEESNSRKVAP